MKLNKSAMARAEKVGDMTTHPDYWDCECKHNFIHKKVKGNFCKICGSFEHEQPDSRVEEIVLFYFPKKDKVVFKDKPSKHLYED